ncbi:MAG: PEP-CTERM sorting domain-containing protein [Planctomycetota bacterium]|nr:PEP-CTERM sorting domain-containing protein [Planctomycetota bacterium]
MKTTNANGTGLTLACALALLALATTAHAGIVGVSGSVQKINAPSTVNALPPAPSTNATAIARVWEERQDFRLGGALRVDALAPGIYDHSKSLGVWSIDRFETVSSYLIHLGGNTAGVVSGSVTFSGDIVGIVCVGDAPGSGSSLDASDFLSIATTYPDGLATRGVELSTTGDRFSISANKHTLNFWLDSSDGSDSIRVITMVPAPGSLALLGLVGMTTSRRRR